MNMNTGLRVAVAVLLGATMQQGAFANPSISNPLKIALETGAFSSQEILSGAGLVFDIPVYKNREIKADTSTPPSSQPYYVVITLTGGAKFGNITGLKLTCGYTATTLDASTDSPAAVQGGTVAGFRLKEGSMTGSCKLTFGSTALTLTSGVKDYGMKIDARHLDSYDPVSASESGTLVTFTQGMQASVTQGKVTIDVGGTPSSTKFVVGGGSTVSGFATPAVTAVALLGSIAYTAANEVKTVGNATPNATTFVSKFTLTVTGAPLAAVQQTAASGVASAGVYLSTTKCELSAADGGLKYASGTQVSFIGVGSSLLSNDELDVCMIGNDTSIIERGTVNYTISSVSPVGSSEPNLDVVDTTLVKVGKNGTSLKVLNLPSPDYDVDQAFVRFYNMGTTTGKIIGTLYSQGLTDGTNTGGGLPLGSTNVTLIDSIAPGVVTVLSGQQIAAKFGQTKWPGRAWLQIESEVKGLRVQALVRSGGYGGTLTNMSDRVMLDGESVSRTE